MSITGDEKGNTAKVGVAVIDVATGLHASSAILSALYRREETGLGLNWLITLGLCSRFVGQSSSKHNNFGK